MENILGTKLADRYLIDELGYEEIPGHLVNYIDYEGVRARLFHQ